MTHLPLFDSVALPPLHLTGQGQSAAMLSSAPSSNKEQPPRRQIASAHLDPIGHLDACPGCPSCDALQRQGFVRCSSCPRWAHRTCLYDGKCTGCHIQARGEFDGREMRHEWPGLPWELRP
jgi:hypothetical protein